jgi:hypothetical protein
MQTSSLIRWVAIRTWSIFPRNFTLCFIQSRDHQGVERIAVQTYAACCPQDTVLVQMLLAEGQAHLFESWPSAGNVCFLVLTRNVWLSHRPACSAGFRRPCYLSETAATKQQALKCIRQQVNFYAWNCDCMWTLASWGCQGTRTSAGCWTSCTTWTPITAGGFKSTSAMRAGCWRTHAWGATPSKAAFPRSRRASSSHTAAALSSSTSKKVWSGHDGCKNTY